MLQPYLRYGTYAVYAHDMGVLDIQLYLREEAEETIFPFLASADPEGLDNLIAPEQAKLERDLTVTWYCENLKRADEALRGPFSPTVLFDTVDEAVRYAANEWEILFIN